MGVQPQLPRRNHRMDRIRHRRLVPPRPLPRPMDHRQPRPPRHQQPQMVPQPIRRLSGWEEGVDTGCDLRAAPSRALQKQVTVPSFLIPMNFLIYRI